MTNGVAALILGGSLLGGCGGGPTAPTAVDVSGTWDASFAGIVQGAGTTQTDDFTMELSQSGTTVSGFLRHSDAIDVPITAGRITAGRITAGRITAGRITAERITAGRITAGRITAGRITAGRITAGRITAGRITAGRITAGRITGNRLTYSAMTTLGQECEVRVDAEITVDPSGTRMEG